MAKAKKMPSGNWRALAYSHEDSNGKRHYESFTASTKKEAEYMAAEFMANKKRLSRSDLTVLEAVNGYIDLKSRVLSPSSIRGYRTALPRLALIGNARIKRLDNKTVQAFINEISAEISPKTVRNIYSLLKSAVAMYAPEVTFRVTLPQKAKRIKKAPSEEEVKLIYDKATGDTKKAIYLAKLGLRRGELCALEYEDIKNNYAHIHRNLIRGENGWEVKSIPKTSESERLVLLPDNYKEVLGDGKGRIVQSAPGTISYHFHAIALSFGLDYHIHDMRHYFVSMAHAMGIPDQFIMAMGGFKSDYVMKTVYRNIIDPLEEKYRREYAEKILSAG